MPLSTPVLREVLVGVTVLATFWPAVWVMLTRTRRKLFLDTVLLLLVSVTVACVHHFDARADVERMYVATHTLVPILAAWGITSVEAERLRLCTLVLAGVAVDLAADREKRGVWFSLLLSAFGAGTVVKPHVDLPRWAPLACAVAFLPSASAVVVIPGLVVDAFWKPNRAGRDALVVGAGIVTSHFREWFGERARDWPWGAWLFALLLALVVMLPLALLLPPRGSHGVARKTKWYYAACAVSGLGFVLACVVALRGDALSRDVHAVLHGLWHFVGFVALTLYAWAAEEEEEEGPRENNKTGSDGPVL